jgi:hypothetical protein
MSFKSIAYLILSSLLLLLTACSDTEKEEKLVELFTVASLDIIAISFSADESEDIISIDTFFDYKIEGLKSNAVDIIAINDHIVWSLSDGAASTIDQNGRLSAGSVAEMIAITAKVGNLSATMDVHVSAAKFDQVVMLNSTPVTINMCQAQQIIPLGRYLNDDGSEEIRQLDSTIINSITWLITNQEDDAASQRAIIKTVNSQVSLQALAVGDIFIKAEALSVSTGNIVTSVAFDQTLDNNLNSLKLCLKSETDLAACSLSNTDIVEDTNVSLQAVANYQAVDGTTFNQNVSAYSKWGIDDNSIASIALSADRQQLNVTGNTSGSIATVSVACGNIEQTISNSDLENGVVLDIPVTCASDNLNCLSDTATMNIIDKTVTSFSVTVNGINLVDNSARILVSRPAEIVLNVTANFSDDTSKDVTSDAGTSYRNQSITVITGILNQPGEYTVLTSGDAEIEIIFQSAAFTAKITIPN